MATQLLFSDFVVDKLGNGNIDFATAAFKSALYTNASNISTSVELQSSLTGEVAAGNGYVAGGVALANVQWVPDGGPNGQRKWTHDPAVFAATTGSIDDIRYAAVYLVASSIIIGYADLKPDFATEGPISIPAGKDLQLTAPVTGVLRGKTNNP